MRPIHFETKGLHARAGGFQLCDISVSLDIGQYLIILGPTGCGKTMLLETLAGLRQPTKGGIYLRGKDITSLPPESRQFGFAYQDSLLYPFLNVEENILFGAAAQKKQNEPYILKRLERLSEAMGISHLLNRYPRFLSGGEKQRVSLARAVLTSPPLLLLDEPLSSLDPLTRCSMQELLKEIHKTEELGIVHVTHDFNEALQLGTHLLVMDDGIVLQQGKCEDVFINPVSLDIAKFLMCENLLHGSIERVKGQAWFKHSQRDFCIGPLDTDRISENTGPEVTLLIWAGNLNLSSYENCDTLTLNNWYSRIEQINLHSTHIEVICTGDSGCNYRIFLSSAEWKRLNLEKGADVRLSVNVNDVQFV